MGKFSINLSIFYPAHLKIFTSLSPATLQQTFYHYNPHPTLAHPYASVLKDGHCSTHLQNCKNIPKVSLKFLRLFSDSTKAVFLISCKALILPPGGHLTMSGDISDGHGRSQGCRRSSTMCRASSTQNDECRWMILMMLWKPAFDPQIKWLNERSKIFSQPLAFSHWFIIFSCSWSQLSMLANKAQTHNAHHKKSHSANFVCYPHQWKFNSVLYVVNWLFEIWA